MNDTLTTGTPTAGSPANGPAREAGTHTGPAPRTGTPTGPRPTAPERAHPGTPGPKTPHSGTPGPRRSHLDSLESEAVHIFREVAGEFERPVILFSGGK
ncbi:hypothetical protein ACFWEP_14615, partial [Streptomyces sp. NPDC060198]